jgi:hypothetical protein
MLLLRTVSFAQQVKFDYDPSANFGQYESFSSEMVQTKDPLLGLKIKKGKRLAHPPSPTAQTGVEHSLTTKRDQERQNRQMGGHGVAAIRSRRRIPTTPCIYSDRESYKAKFFESGITGN